MIKNTVGLFGVCGSSTWRDNVISNLAEAGVDYYNPHVKNWSPELAKVEAEHLATDKVIFMVINEETTAFGSLAEVGFAYYHAMNNNQSLILVIVDYPDHPKSDANRTRALVKAHCERVGLKVYPSVEEGLVAVIEAMKG